MNIQRRLRPLLVALPLVAATSLQGWAEQTPEQAKKIEQLAARDPQGLIMTLTAVLVVFSALAMLVIIFKLIGRLFQSSAAKPGAQPQVAQPAPSGAQPSSEAMVAIGLALRQLGAGEPGEVAAAVSMALRSELYQQHDQESYVLTIRRRPTLWNAHVQGVRSYSKH